MQSNDLILTINGIDLPIITDLNIQFEKLWGDDTGREVYKDGEFFGTLIGIFPKLEVEFAPKTPQQLKQLIDECNKPFQILQWYNPRLMSKVTSVFYSNSFGVSLKNALSDDFDRIKVNFISKKRGG